MTVQYWNWSWVKVQSETNNKSNSIDQSGGVIYSYRAATRGRLSASELTTSISSISTNINQIWRLWGNNIRPILNSLPAGERDERWRIGKGLPSKIDAFAYGIQGTTLFVLNDADSIKASGRYWHVTGERPITIAEAFENVWSVINDISTPDTTSTTTDVELDPLWAAIGHRYQDSSLSSLSTSLDSRTGVLEGNIDQLSEDIYGASEGFVPWNFGIPLNFSIAQNIDYILKLHGVAAGWQNGDPAGISHEYSDSETNVARFVGMTDYTSTVEMPTYSSTNYIVQSSNLETAIGALDTAIASLGSGALKTGSGTNSAESLNANIDASGDYSFAMGVDSTASGNYSTVMGDTVVASSSYSLAIGTNITSAGWMSVSIGNRVVHDSSSNYSFAMGVDVTISDAWCFALGDDLSLPYSSRYSFVMGWNSAVDGFYNFAFGYDAITGNASHSFAFGLHATSTALYSFAFGYEATATAANTLAFGSEVEASAASAFAMGDSTTVASGICSFAFGRNTTASAFLAVALGSVAVASGQSSFAMGATVTAEGTYSFAKGSHVSTSSTALYSFIMGSGSSHVSGEYSFVFGEEVSASGNYAFAMGNSNNYTTDRASGLHSFSFGYDTIASGQAAFAFGMNATVASGNYSFAFGWDAVASGTFSMALGEIVEAGGNFSTVSGYESLSPGDYSFAKGNTAVSTGSYSFAFGNTSTATGDYSFSFGSDTTFAGKDYSFAFGYDATADGDYSIAIGNTVYGSGDYSFVTGVDSSALVDYAEARGNGVVARWKGARHFTGQQVNGSDSSQCMDGMCLVGQTDGVETITLMYESGDTISPLFCPDDTLQQYRVYLTLSSLGGIETGYFDITVVRNEPNFGAIESTWSSTYSSGILSTPLLNAVVENTNKTVELQVTGVNGQDIIWVAHVVGGIQSETHWPSISGS